MSLTWGCASKRVRRCFDIICPTLCFLVDPVQAAGIWGSRSKVCVVVFLCWLVWGRCVMPRWVHIPLKQTLRHCVSISTYFTFLPIWLVLFVVPIVLFHTSRFLLRCHMERVIKTYRREDDDNVIMRQADLL